MNIKELYDSEIKVAINDKEWKLKIEAATHPMERAVLLQLVNPDGEPKHFMFMDKEIFKARDKDTVMKEIIEPVINKLKARETK